MFEHLDDNAGFTPDADFRRRVGERGRRLRRRRRGRVVVAGAGVSALLLVGSVAAYGAWQLHRVDRIHLVQTTQPDDGDGLVTFVVVGEDSDGPEARADAVEVITFDRTAGTAAMLAVPRDLWLDGDRVSTLYATRGPDGLLAALHDSLGVEANHFVAVDFSGMVALVNALGGVDIAVDMPARDAATGLALPAACSHLDGESALALARSRHLESLVDGVWTADPSGDFGRIDRDHVLLMILLGDVQRIVADPGDGQSVPQSLATAARAALELNRLVGVAVEHLTMDDALSSGDLLDLAEAARSLDAAAVTSSVVPVTPTTTPAGAAVLDPAGPGTAFVAPVGVPIRPCTS